MSIIRRLLCAVMHRRYHRRGVAGFDAGKIYYYTRCEKCGEVWVK